MLQVYNKMHVGIAERQKVRSTNTLERLRNVGPRFEGVAELLGNILTSENAEVHEQEHKTWR